MSFGKLLAMGKSLAGGKNEGRYRPISRAIVPKFGPPKNPFAPAPEKNAAPAQPTFSAPNLPPQGADAAARAVPDPTTNGAARASVTTRTDGKLAPFSRRLNPISWFARRQKAGKPMIPRFGQKPVQEELHLENVRVVRNDLADSDLEVVRVGAGSNKNVPSGTAWGHLVSRIFGSGPTH